MSFIRFLQEEWGLTLSSAHLIEDNQIDLALLQQCEYSDLEPIVHELPLGDRIRFKRGIERLKAKEAEATIADAVIEIDPDITAQEVNELQDLLEAGTSHANSTAKKQPEKQPDIQPETQPENPEEVPQTPINPAPTESPRRSPRIQAKLQASALKNKDPKKNLFGKETSEKSITSHESLLKILEEDFKGKAVMVSYSKSDNLTDRQRAIVTNIVIRSELTETNDQKIKRERFLELQKYICRIFPTEEKDTWYTPYRVVNKTGIAARGRLVDCYYNMRQDLLASGTIQSLRKRKSDTFTAPTAAKLANKSEQLTFLRTQLKPYATIEKFWLETVEERLNEYTEKNIPIHEYFSKYPILGTKDGVKLILLDCQKKHPELEHVFFTAWPVFRRKFLQFVQNSTDAYMKKCAKDLKIEFDVLNEEYADVQAARLLAALLIKVPQKLTKNECIDGFLSTVLTKADAILKGDQRREKFSSLGRPLQPFPIVVVDKEKTVVQSYAHINNVLFELESPTSAIDFCFKTCFLLNANYPPEARIAWQFIQKNLYDKKSDFDINFQEERKLFKKFLEYKAQTLD